MRKYRSFSINKAFDGAFLIDESWLRRLSEDMKNFINNKTSILFEVNLESGASFETKDIEDIIKEENKKDEKIKRIEIEVSRGDYSTENYRRIKVDLGSWSSDRVAFEVLGSDRDWVSITCSKLEDRILQAKQWYGLLVKSYDGLSSILRFVIVYVILLFVLIKYREHLPLLNSEIFKIIFYALFIPSWVISHFLSISTNFLFPVFIFEIGLEIKQMERIKNIREKVLWFIPVSIILGWLGSKIL